MDLTKPIDITAVNNTGKKYTKDIQTLDKRAASEFLQYMTPHIGVKSTLGLTTFIHNEISKRYTGAWVGDKTLGTLKMRDLVVKAIVAEISDEPERYRESYITEVAGGLDPLKHPFELWLINQAIDMASEELLSAIWKAVYSADPANTTLLHSFDGLEKQILDGITASDISVGNANLYSSGAAYTVGNIGDFLLAQWRAMPETFRRKGGLMVLSHTMGELYDDWYKAEHDSPPNMDTAGQTTLDGSNGKCVLVRTSIIPASSQRVLVTVKGNMHYGTDKLDDMRKFTAFSSGNPYLFTAAMKYIFGVQFGTFDKRLFSVNDRS